MRKLSEMARARALVRKLESQDRKKLKSEMAGSVRITIEDLDSGKVTRRYYGDYDSKKATMLPSTEWTNNAQPIKTISDILQEFEITCSDRKTKHHHGNQVDKLVDIHITEEVRDYWRQRIAKGNLKFDATPEQLAAKKK